MQKFLQNNSTVETTKETDHINLAGLWNDTTLMCRYSKDENLEILDNAILPEEFSAIINKKEGYIEFIFMPLDSEDEIINREFEFNYHNHTFKLCFEEVSPILEKLAQGFRRNEESSETRYRNLRPFRDYYREDKSPGMEKFFENRIPISFFVKGDIEKIGDLKDFAKHLNFYMRYYHRKAPTIVLFNEKKETEKYEEFCHTTENGFPQHINSIEIEPVILDLFEIASDTPNI